MAAIKTRYPSAGGSPRKVGGALEGAEMTTVAKSVLDTPFRLAVTVSVSVPGELPAVKVVDKPVIELRDPSELLRVQV